MEDRSPSIVTMSVMLQRRVTVTFVAISRWLQSRLPVSVVDRGTVLRLRRCRCSRPHRRCLYATSFLAGLDRQRLGICARRLWLHSQPESPGRRSTGIVETRDSPLTFLLSSIAKLQESARHLFPQKRLLAHYRRCTVSKTDDATCTVLVRIANKDKPTPEKRMI
jgi:hypothetical protein